MSAFDVAISIAAILGNVLILVAFRKVSARVLHPPSKLLFECLAYSDLSVSLVLQPLRIISYNSYENTESCFYALFASWIVGNIFMWSFSPYTNCNRCGQTSRPYTWARMQAGSDFKTSEINSSLVLALQQCYWNGFPLKL